MAEEDMGDLKQGLEVTYKAWIYQGRLAMFHTKSLSQLYLSDSQVLAVNYIIVDESVMIVFGIL